MTEQQNTLAYISHVHLKGYKSIRDMEVRLNSGLNIIIGKNGSGKTNFVGFLNNALSSAPYPLVNQPYFIKIIINSPIGVFNLEEKFDAKRKDMERWGDDNLEGFYTKIIDNESNEAIGKQRLLGIRQYFNRPSGTYKLLYPIFIPFSSLKISNMYMLSELGYISINEYDVIIKINDNVFSKDLDIEFDYFNEDKISIKKIKGYLELNKKLIDNLSRYTPIKNLRLSKSLDIDIEPFIKSLEIKYLMLEFYVNKTWHVWDELSDGTKRLFHIVSEINGTNRSLILLEEPENGVHPDQLYLLMDFIKEQSKEKQIILTTHSPDVLNILEKDELDRIIVTRFDEEKKTQMHHLSEKQKEKAMLYMEETSNLSDFWVHSTLEEYEAEFEIAE